jgi:hypothetical protein
LLDWVAAVVVVVVGQWTRGWIVEGKRRDGRETEPYLSEKSGTGVPVV